MSQMKLTVTLRKVVETPEQAEQLYNLVKERLTDHPEVKITGSVANHFDQPEQPPG